MGTFLGDMCETPIVRSGDGLRLEYIACTIGGDVPFLWAAHPQFSAPAGTVVQIDGLRETIQRFSPGRPGEVPNQFTGVRCRRWIALGGQIGRNLPLPALVHRVASERLNSAGSIIRDDFVRKHVTLAVDPPLEHSAERMEASSS